MSSNQDEVNGAGEGINRRKVLECMTWAGTGVLWTVAGGVPLRSASSARRRRRPPRA